MSLAWDWFCLLRSFEPALSLKKRAYHFMLSQYKPQPVLNQEPSFVKENHPVFRSLHNGMGPQQKWQQESVLKKKIWYKEKKLQYFYSQSSALPPSMSHLQEKTCRSHFTLWLWILINLWDERALSFCRAIYRLRQAAFAYTRLVCSNKTIMIINLHFLKCKSGFWCNSGTEL